MTTLNFKFIKKATEKAINVVIREWHYEGIKEIKEISFWIPKSVCNVNSNNTIEIQDWFFEKNIAGDPYASFMKALANE